MPRKKRGFHRHHYSKYKQDRDAANGEETAIAHRVEQQEATRKRRAQCAESARLSGMTAELGEAAYRIGLSGTKVVADGIVSRRLVGHCQQVEPVDHNEAARQFAIAAAHGDARAQLELGRLLAEEGRGHDAAARLLADGEIPYLRGDRDGWDKWRTSAALERLRMDGDDPRSAKAAWLYALAATQGNNKAAVELAHMLLTGCDGVEQNEAEAIRLFEVAASKHDPHAQYSLGYLHQFAEHGVEQDLQKAAWFYSLAGKQQHGAAQCNLGWMYETVKQDTVEAARLYTLAAANGDAMGQSNLGRLYENGTGVECNVAKAAQLYEQAAEQGNVRAQFAMGKFHSSAGSIPLARQAWSRCEVGSRTSFRPGRWGRRGAERRLPVPLARVSILLLQSRGGAGPRARCRSCAAGAWAAGVRSRNSCRCACRCR